MKIPQDVIKNRDRRDWMHRDVSSSRTPDDSNVTQAQKHVSTARKTTSRIPISVPKTTQRKRNEELSPAIVSSLTKSQIQKQLNSPKSLSATKSYIKEQLFSRKPGEELISAKRWRSFDEQNEI